MTRRLFVYLVLQFLLNQSTCKDSDGQPKFQIKFIDENYNFLDENDTRIAENNKSLIAFVHGFRSHMFHTSTVDFGKSVVRSTDSNVAMIDWSDWTMNLDYSDLVQQLPVLAQRLVDWLNELRDRGIVNGWDDVVLMGHSLGAQLVGYVGHRMNGTLKRIVALDPAQPNFTGVSRKERVDEKSGQFVMVLHTSTVFFGIREPVGHVDFYFNGGKIQPSCRADILCSHIIVLKYFAGSLKNSSDIKAYRCNTVEDCEKNITDDKEPSVELNMDIPITTRGLYLVTEPVLKDFQSRYLKLVIGNIFENIMRTIQKVFGK